MTRGAVVIGGSAGGFQALEEILSALPAEFPQPVLVAQHLHATDHGLFARHLAEVTLMPVVEAFDKAPLWPGVVQVAPANYHLLVEDTSMLSLSVDPPVNFSRPSIDVLFESAARVWACGLTAVLLSGASRDGTTGMSEVKAAGGRNLVQDPATAATAYMPRCALEAGVADEVLSPRRIALRLTELAGAIGRRGKS
jgi:two-component system chemotaxis response regulator CheB